MQMGLEHDDTNLVASVYPASVNGVLRVSREPGGFARVLITFSFCRLWA